MGSGINTKDGHYRQRETFCCAGYLPSPPSLPPPLSYLAPGQLEQQIVVNARVNETETHGLPRGQRELGFKLTVDKEIVA